MKTSLLLVMSGLLSGCITSTEVRTYSAKVQQTYFSELSAYYVLLSAAAQYKESCFAKPDYLQQDCREVVRNLRDIALRVEEIRDLTDRAISVNSDGAIVIATEKLRELKDEIEMGMKKGPSPEAQPKDQPVPPEWTGPVPTAS